MPIEFSDRGSMISTATVHVLYREPPQIIHTIAEPRSGDLSSSHPEKDVGDPRTDRERLPKPSLAWRFLSNRPRPIADHFAYIR